MTTPMSTFNQLANCYLKVCNDPLKQPFQWIYVVDDAWFGLDAVTDFTPIFERSGESPVKVTASIPWKEQAASTGTTTTSILSSAGAATSSNASAQNDRLTAEKLMEFIKEWLNDSCDYGLCFCSFEYFWHHISEINQPQNAVFFDLRHQLAAADATGLLTEWTEKVKAIEFVDDASAGKADILGWILHFSFKFGKIPGAPRCNIANDHFLIISSAISASGRDRDAIAQYLGMQQVIFEKLKQDSVLKAKTKPSFFTFAPLPKNFAAGDTSFETGLAIFHNSFRNQAQWSGENGVRNLIMNDLSLFWTAENQWGHPTTNPGLKWLNWTNDWENTKAIYQFLTNPPPPPLLMYGQFISILKSSMVLRNFHPVTFAADEGQILEIPTNPAIHFLIVLLDFLDCLKEDPSKNDGRVKPSIVISFANNHMEIKITITNDGVNKLNANLALNPAKTTGATVPLRRLKNLNVIHEEVFVSSENPKYDFNGCPPYTSTGAVATLDGDSIKISIPKKLP